MQALRREVAEYRDELRDLQDAREEALVQYFNMWLGDYEEAVQTGRMPSDDEAEFTDGGEASEYEEGGED